MDLQGFEPRRHGGTEIFGVFPPCLRASVVNLARFQHVCRSSSPPRPLAIIALPLPLPSPSPHSVPDQRTLRARPRPRPRVSPFLSPAPAPSASPLPPLSPVVVSLAAALTKPHDHGPPSNVSP